MISRARTLPNRQSSRSINILRHSHGLEARSSACWVDHALVWSSTVCVDLVQRHIYCTASRDLWQSTVCLDHAGGSGCDVVFSALGWLLGTSRSCKASQLINDGKMEGGGLLL